jgi:glycerol-3-phosphate dehydrogenase (NAD(P)+)
MTVKNHVAVLGAGKLGAAVATLLARAGVPVAVWARRMDVARTVASNANGAFAAQSITEACDGAAMVAFCVPTSALREIARTAGEVARGDQIALHGCRGVEQHFTLPHEIIRAESCIKKIAVLGGPLYLDDAERGRPLVAVSASRFDEVQRHLKRITANTHVRIHSTRDVVGVEVCGAISNVAQIAAGLAEGCGLGATDQGILLTRGLIEAQRIGVALGAERATFTGLAGVGDLIPRPVTTTRKHRKLGHEIGSGTDATKALAAAGDLEGVRTVREGRALGERLALSLPLIDAVDDVITHGKPVAPALERVLSMDLELDAAA